jgi:hypothetical protein
LNGLVFLDQNLLNYSSNRRGNLGVNLVGGYLYQRLINVDAVANLF